MGMRSLVLINHDNIHLIEEDPEFGKKLARACCSSRKDNVDYQFGLSGATVVGPCFHASDVVILIAEGGTAWTANWKGKPEWSKLTKSEAVEKMFGPPQSREKKK